MHVLNSLTLFVNPYIINNHLTRKRFERKWRVSLAKTKDTLFRDFYYKVNDSGEFSASEIKFIEAFSKTMLASNKSTAYKIMDAWSDFAGHFGVVTTRGKIISLYFSLIENIKKNGRVTSYKPLLAAEIIDAFAWLFKIQAED